MDGPVHEVAEAYKNFVRAQRPGRSGMSPARRRAHLRKKAQEEAEQKAAAKAQQKADAESEAKKAAETRA
jgi:teichoic acid transport system ATP-binding protein